MKREGKEVLEEEKRVLAMQQTSFGTTTTNSHIFFAHKKETL